MAGLALIVFRFQDAPIAGPGSVGQFSAVASAAVAVVTFALAFVLRRHAVRDSASPDHTALSTSTRILDVLDIAALSVAHAVIALLSWTLLANILEMSFVGAEIFALPLVVLSAAAGAATAYVVAYSATHMDLQLLAVVLATFLVLGVMSSMLTASDPLWWKDNLSALGMTNDLSAYTFNLTLIVAGFIVTTLARYATRDIHSQNSRGIARVRTSLIAVGVLLGCVGIFPVDQYFALHTAAASGMVVAFGTLVLRLPVWMTKMSRVFVVVGWVFLAVILLLAVFFAVGYYTLTAVELVAGILVFTWIVLFIRNAAVLSKDDHADRRLQEVAT